MDTNFQGGPAELKDHEQPFRCAALLAAQVSGRQHVC